MTLPHQRVTPSNRIPRYEREGKSNWVKQTKSISHIRTGREQEKTSGKKNIRNVVAKLTWFLSVRSNEYIAYKTGNQFNNKHLVDCVFVTDNHWHDFLCQQIFWFSENIMNNSKTIWNWREEKPTLALNRKKTRRKKCWQAIEIDLIIFMNKKWVEKIICLSRCYLKCKREKLVWKLLNAKKCNQRIQIDKCNSSRQM